MRKGRCTKLNKRKKVGKGMYNECVLLIKCIHFNHWHNGVLCGWFLLQLQWYFIATEYYGRNECILDQGILSFFSLRALEQGALKDAEGKTITKRQCEH